jgi:uncharacterized coiled-coil protein SlyX
VNEQGLEQRLARVEAALAHLERQFDELNSVAIAQGKLVSRLQKRVEELGSSLESQEMERIRSTSAKPPHYSV